MASRVLLRRARLTAGIAAILAAIAMVAFPTAGPAAAVQHARSPGWHVVKTIKKNSLQLNDVVAVGGGKAWVSGSVGTLQSGPVYFHWTGGKWLKIARPSIPSLSTFGATVSATSDSNVWIAISNSDSFDHWNGHWTRFSFGTTPSARADSVVAIGTDHAWAFTTDFTVSPVQESARFFNGSSWTSPQPVALVDSDSPVNAVSASSHGNIWAWAFDPVSHHWEALHFNGKTWSVVPVPASFIPHHGTTTGGGGEMLAESATNVWATVNSENTAGPMVLLHWNGTAWQKAGGRRPVGELLGPIASDGRGGLWLLAAKPVTKGPGQFFVHYQHGTWTSFRVPASSLGPVSVSGMALIPGTRSLWAVGSALNAESEPGGVILKFRP